jgi:hypothetical protein
MTNSTALRDLADRWAGADSGPRCHIAGEFLIFLRSRQGRTAVSAATTGSVISNLRPDVLKEIELPLPPMDVQQNLRDQVRAILDARSSWHIC